MKIVLETALMLCAYMLLFLCGYYTGKIKVYRAWSKWLDTMSYILKKPEE